MKDVANIYQQRMSYRAVTARYGKAIKLVMSQWTMLKDLNSEAKRNVEDRVALTSDAIIHMAQSVLDMANQLMCH